MQTAARNFNSMISPELRLALWCSNQQNTGKGQDGGINNLLTRSIDWDLYLRLVLNHEVYPLVYRKLGMLAESAVPKEIIFELQQQNRQGVYKTLQLAAELARIMRVMDQNGIHTIVMKGIPLAYCLYGNIMLRPSHDLDILVWPEDMTKARKIIEAQGYYLQYPKSKDTPVRLKRWMKNSHHLSYWQPKKKIWLELHWRLNCYGMVIPLKRIETTTVQLAGQSINIIPAEKLLLYLSLHGAVHAWFNLKWLYDVDLMIRKGDFSWETLYYLANSLGLQSILNQALVLSCELLATPIPANIAEMVTGDTRAGKLAVMALQIIMKNNYKPKSLKVVASSIFERKKYEFCLMSGWQSRVHYILKRFLPSEDDLELITLPDKLYFLYYIISPFTWFGHRVRNVAKRYILG